MEFDLINYPHPHPLIFYQHGKPDVNGQNQNVCCSKCHQPWRPPVFGCLNCNFIIHLSCIHLPPEIRTPFHPQHSLSLKNVDNMSCNCCGQKPYGDIYHCSECNFQIDVQCAIVDRKASGVLQTVGGEFRHFAHSHPLILQQEQQRENRKVFCFLCKYHVESGSTYFCSTCDSHCHQDCAELPREILQLDFHIHSLFLFSYDPTNPPCYNCRNECSNFFYHCPECEKFSLHAACVPSFKHQHEFYEFRKVLPQFDCQVCGKKEYEMIPWVCKTCHLFAHKKCAELPSIIYVSKHDHPLTLTFSYMEFFFDQCEICNRRLYKRHTTAYFCSQCKYIVDLDCAKYLQIEGIDQSMQTLAVDPSGNAKNGFNLKEDTQILQENEIILCHFSHNHNLSLCPGDQNRLCDGCMRSMSTRSQSYGCSQCDFYLHQACAKLPRRYKNSFFHSHELSMVYIPNFVFSCAVCLQYCHGFAYYCKECHYTIDIQCATAPFLFTHPSHYYSLFHYNGNEKHKCKACGEGLKDKAFRCNNCNFYLDRRLAHLPLKVRNRFDEHPLILTAVNQKKEPYSFQFEHNISLPFFKHWSSTGNEYYCDICEEEREEYDWFYSCKLCCFAAHINCVLGDYPFLKSAKFEGHQHPLSLVKEGKKGYSACGACGHSCEGNLAFECGDLSCKFNVHAFGPCYHGRLTQGRITFIMPSLRYRSIPLCPNIGQKEGSNLILSDDTEVEEEADEVRKQLAMSLRQCGGEGGKLWDDRVFLSIKRVVISHGEYIHSIQTEYYDHNENLTWSDRHGGNGGHTSKVELDYPNEYLISIYGYMGKFKERYMIRSLILESNKRIFGPLGKEEGTRFSFPITTAGAIIVGFHGTSSYCLDSIGIKVVTSTRTSTTTTLE